MWAFLVIVVLFAATVLLWLSMRRHLARINVDGSAPEAVAAPDDAALDDAGEDRSDEDSAAEPPATGGSDAQG